MNTPRPSFSMYRILFCVILWLAHSSVLVGMPSEEDDEEQFDQKVSFVCQFENSVVVKVKGEDFTRFLSKDQALLGYTLQSITKGMITFSRGVHQQKIKLDPSFLEDLNKEIPETVEANLERLEQWLAKDPDGEIYYYQKASLMYKYRPAEAYTWIMQAYEGHPEAGNLQVMRSICMLRLQAYPDTAKFLEHCIRDNEKLLDADFIGIHQYNLACSFSLWGKTDEAITHLKMCLETIQFDRANVESDSDFDPIRETEEFKAILDTLE